MKTCSRCHRAQPDSEFQKHPHTRDGLHSWCKQCNREYQQNRDFEPQWDALQRCATCGETKPGTEFYVNRKTKLGLSPSCKDCSKAISQAYADRYKEQDKPVVVSQVCSACGYDKPASEFYKASNRKSGLYSKCKPCWNEYQKTLREAKKGH